MSLLDPSERDFRHLDDLQLESLRVEMLLSRDEHLEALLRVLVIRAVPVIESVCRQRGEDRGLGAAEINLAIEDAASRLLLRLGRTEPLAAIRAIAGRLAASCIDAQRPKPAPKLAMKKPDMRVVEDLGRALARGRIRPNDWKSS